MQGTNRLVSKFLFEKQAKDRLRALFLRLPLAYRNPALLHLDDFFTACLEGRGLGPQGYFEVAQWLSGRRELGYVGKTARKNVAPETARAPETLRILFVTGVFPSLKHGGGLRTFDIMRGLAARHAVSLYTLYEPGDEAELKDFGFLKATRLAADSNSFLSGYEDWLEQQAEFDAVHFIWPRAANLMAHTRPRTRRMVFEYIESVSRASAMNLLREIESKSYSARSIFQLLEAFDLESKGTGLADSTVSLIPEDQEFAAHTFGSAKGTVVPTGISDFAVWEKVALNPEPPANRDALFLGFFTHTPNQVGVKWYLERVHPLVLKSIPDYRFVIAGAGAETAMRQMVQGHDRVAYEGPFENVVDRIASCRIGLAPLITGAGLRGKVNQYSAIGRPTVSTSIGTAGLPYVNGESVMVADDPREFANAVIRLLTDDDTYESVRTRAQRIARTNHQWSNYLPKLEKLYAR